MDGGEEGMEESFVGALDGIEVNGESAAAVQNSL